MAASGGDHTTPAWAPAPTGRAHAARIGYRRIVRRDAPAPRSAVARALGLALLLLACRPEGSDGSHDPAACPALLADAVDLATLRQHLDVLADLGDGHGGNRVAGSSGYDASADYVADRLRAAGLAVHRQDFQFDDYELHAVPRLRQVVPVAREYEHGVEFRAAMFSASGDVEGPVIPVDLALGSGANSTSGCDPDDFAAFFPGSIALLQRGGCPHTRKIANAVAAGAAAVLYFNQGDRPERMGLFTPWLARGTTIPVVALPYAGGESLAGAGSTGLVVRVVVDGEAVVRHTVNLLGETAPTASGRVIMLGAHLDSVAAGPGINDNGSGVAALLGVAAGLSTCEWRHQVRLAFWGAEEYGLLGSSHYVAALSADERAQIALYINLDMVASPNPVRFIYDGDGSAWQKAGPEGSAAIEAAFAAYFAALDLPTRETPFDGRSDYWAFINREIPAGGLFTGAEDPKTTAEVALFGGEAEVAYDPCYHASCDDRDNVHPEALLENTRAAAHVAGTFAVSDPPLPASTSPAPREARSPGPAPYCHECE